LSVIPGFFSDAEYTKPWTTIAGICRDWADLVIISSRQQSLSLSMLFGQPVGLFASAVWQFAMPDQGFDKLLEPTTFVPTVF
jgi:hypothetical protein